MLVGSPHQVHPAIFIPLEVGVVTSSHVVRTELVSVLDEGLELNFLVADNVRVRGPALLVLRDEVFEDPVPVFLLEVNRVVRNPDLGGNLGYILVVLGSGTDPVFIGVVPVLHEDPDDIVTLPLQ